jgi:hypothetical protein
MVDVYKEQEESAELNPESRFRFQCHPGLDCFNQCCQNPTVILKPYDIIRLRRRLEMTSTEFLERCTVRVAEDKSHLPLILLDIDQEAGGCPFLGTDGCMVYEDRPSACRLFPIVQGSSLVRGDVQDVYFCKCLDFCQGFGGGPEWTLARWQADQGLEPDGALDREWVEILLKRGAMEPSADDTRAPAVFAMTAYDIDRFRRFVFETPFIQMYEIPAEVAAVLQRSDEELLRCGYNYLKMVLLLEDAGRMRQEMRRLRPGP